MSFGNARALVEAFKDKTPRILRKLIIIGECVGRAELDEDTLDIIEEAAFEAIIKQELTAEEYQEFLIKEASAV